MPLKLKDFSINMHRSYCWNFPIFILGSIFTLTYQKTCIPTNHKVITDQETYTILNRKNFERGKLSGNSLPMIFDKKNRQIIIGAKDRIFFLNETTLEIIETHQWESDKQKLSSCRRNKNTPEKFCSNYIHYLAIHKNKLFACGTNSLVPKYRILTLGRLDVLKEKVAYGICSLRPDYAVVGDITDTGELISATYKDYTKYPVISSNFVFKDQLKRKEKEEGGNHEYLNEPKFISSVSADESVYIFIMENAIEDKGRRKSTVVRLCKSDNGASRLMSEAMWTSFRKSRLVCIIERNNEQYNFQNLVDVVYDAEKEIFYASYTMFKNINLYSAVCAFSKKDIDKTFSGKFLETSIGNNYLKPVDNGNFLFGCNVNPKNLTTSKPLITTDGKQPTNHLTHEALAKAMHYSLMADEVKHNPRFFEFLRTGVSFTQISVFSVKITNTTSEDNGTSISSFPILYIGTEEGNILMIYIKKDPCIVRETLTNVGKIKQLLINEEKKMLYVNSDSKLISLNIDYCDEYKGERECIQAHDPLCAWSLTRNNCVAVWSEQNLKQDLSICPKEYSSFGPWSNWSICEYSSKRFCRCRSRACLSCNISSCSDNNSIEVKNCSANHVVNVGKWISEGPIDGKWSKWNHWSICGKSKCGNYTRSRSRTCTSPSPANGGRECEGGSFQCKSCAVSDSDPVWSSWGSWSKCSRVKGSYVMNSTRNCSQPYSCIGSSIKQLPCTPNGTLEWSQWSVCSCVQRIRHRMPILKKDCSKCPQLTYPQYEICECDATSTTIDVQHPSQKQTICTPAPSVKKTNDTTGPTNTTMKLHATNQSLASTIEPISKIPQTDSCDPNNKFSLQQLLIILSIVIAIFFMLFALVIILILRQKHAKKILLTGRSNSFDQTPLKTVSSPGTWGR